MRRRTYTFAFLYSLFAYFLFLPTIHGNRSDFSLPSFSFQINKVKSFASSIYAKIAPTHISTRIRASPTSSRLPILFSLIPKEEPPQTPVSSIFLEPDSDVVVTESVELPIEITSPSIPLEPTAIALPAVSLQEPTPIEISTKPAFFSFTGAPPPKAPVHKTKFPIPKRLMVSHDTSYGDDSGIAYGADYTTFGIFLAPDYSIGSFYPLIDLRGHRFDNDSYAFNFGIGGRYVPSPNSFCEILGFNAYYDWRQGFLNQYNQFSVGLEVLGKRWDFRANGYFPVGAKSFRYTCVFDDYEGDYVIVNEKQEITTYGFNAEVGWLAIASKNFLLYFAAGPYYLTTKSNCFGFEPICGGRVRVRPQYRDYFALDVSFSHDSTFNTVWQTTFIVSAPLYQIKNQNERPCRLTDRQIYQPIERFEVMSLGTRNCWWQNF